MAGSWRGNWAVAETPNGEPKVPKPTQSLRARPQSKSLELIQLLFRGPAEPVAACAEKLGQADAPPRGPPTVTASFLGPQFDPSQKAWKRSSEPCRPPTPPAAERGRPTRGKTQQHLRKATASDGNAVFGLFPAGAEDQFQLGGAGRSSPRCAGPSVRRAVSRAW